jgi:glycosyltransferase involved in cell wall biosynthesis
MDISVVVPTFNRREIVKRCLSTLFAQTLAPSRFEIIVVVDGSSDGTAEALRELKAPCQFRVIEQKNLGLAGARNTGFRAAAANLVLFLDDDMLADPGLVAAHLDAHLDADRKRSRIVAFGAIYLSSDSPSCLAADCFNREIGAFYLDRKRNPQREWQMADCVFGNASLARELLEEAGGFDAAFRMREDLELGITLLGSGVQARYIEIAIAYQYIEKSPADLVRDAEAFAVADVMLAGKHPHALVKGQLNWLAKEPRKRRRLQMAASVHWFVDLLLGPVCAVGEAFARVPAVRHLGVRALQIRRRIHWYRKVRELGWSPDQNLNQDTDRNDVQNRA